MKEYIVESFEEGQKLEKFVKRHLEKAPLSFIYKLFRKKDVKVNGKRCDAKFVISKDDVIQIYVTDKQLEDFEKRSIDVSYEQLNKIIVYEDENILILNKPKGILVQRNEKNGRALDQLVKAYFLKNHPTSSFLPAPAHRIDRNTSGIIIFGKSVLALQVLDEAFKERNGISKTYITLVNGTIKKSGRIDTPLFKNPDSGLVTPGEIKNGAKSAITLYDVKENYKDFTLLNVKILTGRTHQIRAHMLSINHPVVGDPKYGDFKVNKVFEKDFNLSNQFLHSYSVSFSNLKEPLSYLNNRTFTAEMPEVETNILKALKTF